MMPCDARGITRYNAVCMMPCDGRGVFTTLLCDVPQCYLVSHAVHSRAHVSEV
eukprot:jgi/Botrbrau1/10716/Bobra.357_1s0018.1